MVFFGINMLLIMFLICENICFFNKTLTFNYVVEPIIFIRFVPINLKTFKNGKFSKWKMVNR
jgi:hypothetical protein